MASLTNIVMSLTDSNATFLSYSPLGNSLAGDPKVSANNFMNYLKRLIHGDSVGTLSFSTGAAKGTAVVTVTGAASNDETMVVCGVTFTAKTSGATGNQFNLSATVGTQAANMVTAFNASADLTGIVTAANVAGVVTLTAVVPGAVGNALVVTESLSNCTVTTTFAVAATGSNGTIYSVDLS